MIQKTLAEIFERDLTKLAEEIMLYKSEVDLWKLAPGISNTAGNLCMHLVGNLNHFIGATMGNTGYIRVRDDEFNLKNIPREKLIKTIHAVIPIVSGTIAALSNDQLNGNFPLEKHGQIVSTNHMLLHLFGHLNYHLGQINYHRRLLTEH